MCERKHMQLETKFLRLPEPAALGDHLDGWRVCWLGGWDRSQLFYWVMVVRIKPAAGPQQSAVGSLDMRVEILTKSGKSG